MNEFRALYCKPTSLYRAFDRDGVLLYVGVSFGTLNRLLQHRVKSQWFTAASNITIEYFPDRWAALRAEKQAISTENPVFNLVGRKSWRSYDAINKAKRDAGLVRARVQGVRFGRRPKLTDPQRTEIIHRCEAGEAQRLVAKDFDVDQATVSRVVKSVS